MIENTSNRDPIVHLAGSLDGVDSYVTGMESAGQRQLLASAALPSQGNWAELESLGFIRGEPVDGDPLFVNATLPEGWTKEGSDHAMWSYILDERRIRRVAVFYKAAFYDRKAHINVENVGYSFGTQIIYGEGPVALPEPWPLMTIAERKELASNASGYLEQAREYPEIYGDRARRAIELLDLITGQAAR